MRTLMILTTGLTLCLMAVAWAAPRLVIDETVFDFGYVPQNAKVSHTFWLKAAGDDSLKILKVTPGCGCTKAPLERSHLAAGDSTRLEIIFSTGSRRGKVSKSPSIQTNAGGPNQRVKINTDIVTRPDSTYPIIIAPYKLTFVQVGDKARDRMTFTITNVSPDDIEIRLVDQPSEYFDVDLPTTIAPQSSAEGSLRLKDVAMAGSFTKSFTIELNDEKRTRFTVPVKHDARRLTKAESTTEGAPK